MAEERSGTKRLKIKLKKTKIQQKETEDKSKIEQTVKTGGDENKKAAPKPQQEKTVSRNSQSGNRRPQRSQDQNQRKSEGGQGQKKSYTGQKQMQNNAVPPAAKDAPVRSKHRTNKVKEELIQKEKKKSQQEEDLLKKVKNSVYKKKKKGESSIPTEIEIGEVVKVSDLAKKMNLKSAEIIQKLMGLGVSAMINDDIDSETAEVVASEFNCKVVVHSLKEEVVIKEEADKEEDLQDRIPVVTIMGHVDHGKTKLLDAIRDSSVAEKESGGITQHIGAYIAKTSKGYVTFIDTPGHEAFTEMRARGANVTDIVILVVAADDGVMPQTLEAMNHAKAAKVPIIVAVNKMDRPEANMDRVKQQLAEYNLLPEDWGGDTMYLPVSALKKQGVEELLEAISLQAEFLELKANPSRPGIGYVVESKMDIGRGAVATVIVKNGKIKIGDNFVVGNTMGKVRGMFDESLKRIKEAGPSKPVEIMGFNEVPEAGDKFYVVESEVMAKDMSNKRQQLKKIEDNKNIKRLQMQQAMDKMISGDFEELKMIIKADVQGSVEAIQQSLAKLQNDKVKINVIHSGVGAVLESDVLLASATDKTENTEIMILGFRVRIDNKAKLKAESEKITVKRFTIIYELLDYVENLLKGMVKIEMRETVIGSAEILNIFKIKNVGKIAGCMVKDGYIRKSSKVRIYRDGIQIWEGQIKALKRFQDDVSEVQVGFECGLSFINYENMKKGDVIECLVEEEVK